MSHAINTDIIGVEKSLRKRVKLQGKRILIMGGGGAGYPAAIYLLEKYKCKVFIFDIQPVKIRKEIIILSDYKSLASLRYDVIINASPVGKYFLDSPPLSFASPLNVDIFSKIIKSDSIVLEMNYFPYMTELLKIGSTHHIDTIPGTEMLTYQALASLYYYTGKELSENEIKKLIKRINTYSIKKETQLYGKSINNS